MRGHGTEMGVKFKILIGLLVFLVFFILLGEIPGWRGEANFVVVIVAPLICLVLVWILV